MKLRPLAACLVLPLALLLFIQWPLREWIHAYTRLANDLAQALFALYVSVAVYAASRAGAHLSLDLNVPQNAAKVARSKVALQWLCVVPWACFCLWSFGPDLYRSLTGLERFPDSNTPGYFVLKLALVSMLFLMIAHATRLLAQSFRSHRS